jgi:hypothetical protein
VKEVARLFERAGVSRTERSVIKWCQPNRQGIARLDSYFDPNERKYFITPASVELAIKEELHRSQKTASGTGAEAFGTVRKESEPDERMGERSASASSDEVKTLKQEILDLKITNRAKDMFIEELQKEREGFAIERQGYVDKLIASNRRVGELETKLMQLSAPTETLAKSATAEPGTNT